MHGAEVDKGLTLPAALGEAPAAGQATEVGRGLPGGVRGWDVVGPREAAVGGEMVTGDLHLFRLKLPPAGPQVLYSLKAHTSDSGQNGPFPFADVYRKIEVDAARRVKSSRSAKLH